MEAFWERLGKLVDERTDAALERALAKVDDGKGSPGPGAGAAAAGGGSGGAGEPPNPRTPQASGGNFLDVLTRVALGKNPTK